MSSIELAEKAMRNVALEREWTKKRMKGDPLFGSLDNTRRDHAHLGRLFVAWTIVDGAPQLDTLFKIDRFGVNNEGLYLIIRSESATHSNVFQVNHTPHKAPGLNLYFWIPHHAEVRSVPYDRTERFRCTFPILVRYQYPFERGQEEGRLYFASKHDFVALWPDHDF